MNAPARRSAWRSLSGHELEGEKLVRLIYLDEAGIGKITSEPIVVVAGVILHADIQLKGLEDILSGIAAKHLPEADREGFVFHATDIFQGTGYFIREKWPREKRWAILDDLMAIPAGIYLPVLGGFTKRGSVPPDVVADMGHTELVAEQTYAFMECAVMAEMWMRHSVPNEVALMVAEDNQQARAMFKEAHAAFKDPKLEVMPGNEHLLPLTHIVDTVHFAAKTECAALQMADACAFSIKRYLMGKPFAERFFDPLRPQLNWATVNAEALAKQSREKTG